MPMGKIRRANVRRTAPFHAKQVENTTILDKAEGSQLAPQRQKIFATAGSPCKVSKRSNALEKVSFKVNIPKRIRHLVAFKSPYKGGEQTKLTVAKSYSSTTSSPALSPYALPKLGKAIKTSDIISVNTEQATSSEISAATSSEISADDSCDLIKQNVKAQERKALSRGGTVGEMKSTQNLSSLNYASSSVNVDDISVNEAKISSVCTRSSKHDETEKKSLQYGTSHLQNSDQSTPGKGCRLKTRRNLLSLRNKFTNKENLADNQRNTEKPSTTSSKGDELSRENLSRSHKNTKLGLKCPNRKEFHVKPEKGSQSSTKTENLIMQTATPDLYIRDPETMNVSNCVSQCSFSNKNYSSQCSRKITLVSQGSFPIENGSLKIRDGNPSVLSCARTLGCPTPDLNWDIRDFELKTSFRHYRRNLKKN